MSSAIKPTDSGYKEPAGKELQGFLNSTLAELIKRQGQRESKRIVSGANPDTHHL